MGCCQRGLGGVTFGGRRPSRNLESPLLSLCACGAGPAGGDPVEASGQDKGLSGPHPAAAFRDEKNQEANLKNLTQGSQKLRLRS